MKPITAPAVNATCSPSFRLPLTHAAVVRTLPSVATIMPSHPAAALRLAPKTNATEMRMPSERSVAGAIVNSRKSVSASPPTNIAR